MGFAMYFLLPEGAPRQILIALKNEIDGFLGRSDRYSSKIEESPLNGEKSIRLDWRSWSANVSYEEGKYAKDSIKEIRESISESDFSSFPMGDKLFYVFFATDSNKEHTTQIVDIMTFFELEKKCIMFDPRRKELIKDK